MALVPKIDPNKIFASNAPSQDKPAAFDNYEKGMDETRKNLGRPTIPQLNYLHQTADQKILWIHQNGGGLPYDASIEYAEKSVTLKDGELKQLVGGAWVEVKTKALPATAITTASSQNQQQINDFGGAKWYAKVGGYELGATVKLDNGDTAQSTAPSNTVNPNLDMTGWVKTNDTSQIFDGDKNQKSINAETLKKTYSLKDAGGIGGGANDTAALTSAALTKKYVLLNTDNSLIRQAILNQKVALIGDSNLIQDTTQQHTVLVGFAKGTSGDLSGSLIEDSLFLNTKFGYMPKSSTDDFSALHVAAGDNTRTVLSSFNTSETGTSFSATDAKFAKPSWGSIDSLALCNSYKNVRRFTIQNLQASYSRIIGISSHNYGDNTAVGSGGVNVNNGGTNMGVRLAGICKGNLVSSSNIRDRRSAVEFQIGCKYNVVQGSYFENSYSNAINFNTDNFAVGGSQNISATTIIDSGDSAVRLRYGGHCRLDALIDTAGLTTGSSGYGVEAFSMTTGDEHFILEFNAGSGTVPTVGTVITQGAASGVLVRVVADSLSTIAPSSTMPAAGTILLKSITGGVFKSGALTGISAIVTRAYAAEGRHRIDVTSSNTKSSSLRIGTDGNLVDLISTDLAVADLNLAGNHNNIRVVAADNNNDSVYSIISGNNNTVNLVDNCKNTAKTVLSISGNDNTVFVNSKARISISGNGNTVVALVNRVTVTGINNSIGGNGSIVDTSSGWTNKYTNHIRGSIMGSKVATTDGSGSLTFSHGLATTAKYVSVELLDSSGAVFAKVSNVATSQTTSTIKVYNLDGSVAAYQAISFLYQANC